MDPTAVRTLVVTADDVVSAAEARRNGRPVVLRATPPFHGRMRARLHVASPARSAPPDGADESVDAWTVVDPAALHVDPWGLFDADAPPYPTPAATEDRLRASGRPFSTESHREYHATAVAAWRRAVARHVRGELTLLTDAGPRQVDVGLLG
ncbi:hypothetical protein [Halomarina oriensis]|uniref:DUF8009 domain-containing protein n=1 Tax=Halomarina oriensis TaxID=671145 RepID=A0A6B0GHU7_9EURY|nr:hypothetical protein [Halomarina oriensis]MWG34180.1 hypothetical protein [Halomarina oriensis]